MQKLLITGSSGFIGTYFINKYKEDYHINTFSFLNDDLKNLNLSCIDTVIHLSALVHQMDGAHEDQYKRVNLTQTLELATKAKQNGVKHFIFMSTIAVYGEGLQKINISTDKKPVSLYGKSKLEAEIELMKLNDDNFMVSIIEPPMVYGENAPGNVDTLVKIIKKVSFLPLGAIENRRSFIYIGNICYVIDILVNKKVSGIFLVSDDESISTTRFIKLIAKELSKKVYLVRVPLFPGLLKSIKPSFYKRLYRSLEVDNTQTKEKLSLKNLYSVEDGIKYMINGEKI